MKHKKKSRVKLPVQAYLLYLALASFLLTGVTFSKYVTTASGSEDLRAAAFGNLILEELDEAGHTTENREYIILPGVDIVKRPAVSFGNQQTAEVFVYVFVSVSAENWEYNDAYGFSLSQQREEASQTQLSWSVDQAAGWDLLKNEGETLPVYFQLLAPGETLDRVPLIAGGTIHVSDKIYASELDELEAAAGNIVFQAFAVQADGFETPQAAWNSVFSK